MKKIKVSAPAKYGKVYKCCKMGRGWPQLVIYTGNVVHKNCRKRVEKEHPVGLPRDV